MLKVQSDPICGCWPWETLPKSSCGWEVVLGDEERKEKILRRSGIKATPLPTYETE